MPARWASYAVSRAPCSSGRVSSTHSLASCPARCAARITANAVPSPAETSRPVLQWVRTRAPAGSSRRPCTAMAALAAASAAAMERASASAAMAVHGLRLLPPGARVLTHCNTGRLVSAGEGTAFAVILAAHRAGQLAKLWVDETRPLLQGARLTAYEAQRAGIDYAVLPDVAAASLLASGEVDVVLT